MAKPKPAPAPALEVVSDPYAIVKGTFLGRWLVVGRTFCGYRAIGRQVHVDGVTPGVVHRVILDAHKRHYAEDENTACQSFFAGIKVEMTTHGASALAVQWVMELEPDAFTEKELKIMADKLQKPVGKGGKLAGEKTDKPKAKGNPEALAKAREAQGARAEARDKQKIKVVNKDHGARAGTKRAEMLDIVLKAKTVGSAIEAGAGWIDVKFAVDSGFISLD